MDRCLEGKTALVTGASRGIGRSIAERLAASGALVAINYAANEGAALETLNLVEAAGGEGFLIHVALGEKGAAEELTKILTEELKDRTGSPELDILVNNVGSCVPKYILETTWDIFSHDVANNITSPFFTTKELIPYLRDNGRVINISSAGSRLALESELIYCMCKGAVDVFTRGLAKELGPRGITVNAVSPGLVATDAAEEFLENQAVLDQLKSKTALGRAYGTSEEIAEVVHALATPAMGWVTGENVEASGGFAI